ncbi:MAG: cyclic pyranopterin monophosphate synthase MoaC [Actinobacteria bacterium]|nr:cyclic pyranopterin monophosphate synthase MoaC [Actinomycetota bacterium]
MSQLSHIDKNGKMKMVDISAKKETLRTAVAQGEILLNAEIIDKISASSIGKGDVIAAARIAGITAAKRTWELIPLCHQARLTSVDIDFNILKKENKIIVAATAKGFDRTGFEMEALTAVSVSLLIIYDMCKALSRDMKITDIKLIKKAGGRSDYSRQEIY